MTQITRLGFLRTRLDERLAQLQAEYRAVFGEDIKIDPDDIDGEWLGIEAEHIAELDQLAEDAYASLNPQTTTGVAQSRLVQLNGIRRIAGLQSMADVVLTGTPGTIIDKGSIIKSAVDNTTWATLADAEIAANGAVTTTVQCTKVAAVIADANTLTKMDTPAFGWETVTNPQPNHVTGRAEETDEELRVRRRASTNTPGQCIVDAVYGSLANSPGVRKARVYENATNVYDANGQPPHSIYCLVEGGNVPDLAQLIWVKKTAGTTTIGNISQEVIDIQGLPHTVNLARPNYVDPYVIVNVVRRPGYPAAGTDLIKQAIVDYVDSLKIGESLLNSRLYTPVNLVGSHYITSILVGTSYPPVSEANLEIAFDSMVRMLPARIEVVET